MPTAYCIVQNGVSHVSSSEVIASVLSIQNVDPDAVIFVSCSQECKRLCSSHPAKRGQIEFYIQDDQRGIDSYLSRIALLAKGALTTGRKAFVLAAGTLVVRPIRLPACLDDQGIAFIDRRPNVHTDHVALHFPSDALYFSSVDWVDRYLEMSLDVEGLQQESWYEKLSQSLKLSDKEMAIALSLYRLVAKHNLNKFIDSRVYFCSDSFLLLEDRWKPEEVDVNLRRNERDIFLVACKKSTLDLPGGAELFSTMLDIVAKKDPYYIMLLPMSLSSLSQGVSLPSPSSLRAWNRDTPVSRVSNLLTALCDSEFFAESKPKGSSLYYTVGTCIVYDAIGDERCTPHLSGGTSVVHADYDDSLLVALREGDFAKKHHFIGYLPRSYATLSFHDPMPMTQRKNQIVHLGELPQTTSDEEEYVKTLLRIREARFALVGRSTAYVAEALALGTVLLLGDSSVSELIDLEEDKHYFKSDDGLSG
jgi:hypothetical protein